MLERVTEGLPRAWAAHSGATGCDDVAASFTMTHDPRGYMIRDTTGFQSLIADGGVAVGMLRTMLRRAVGASLADLTCIEASVVTHRGQAIMLPAQALGGTTTLARALVAAGAELHSEEFALIDRNGRLVSDVEVGSDLAAHGAAPLGLVALTVYQPGARWTPKSITPAEGVVALMACVPAAHEHPADTLATLRSALQEATVLEGERGEAEEAAAGLLKAVAAKPANKSP